MRIKKIIHVFILHNFRFTCINKLEQKFGHINLWQEIMSSMAGFWCLQAVKLVYSIDASQSQMSQVSFLFAIQFTVNIIISIEHRYCA